MVLHEYRTYVVYSDWDDYTPITVYTVQIKPKEVPNVLRDDDRQVHVGMGESGEQTEQAGV